MCKAKPFLDKKACPSLYDFYIQSFINYANLPWGSTRRTTWERYIVRKNMSWELYRVKANTISRENCLKATVGSETVSDNWKPLKNYENCFLFHFKSSFRSYKIFIFLSWLIDHVGKRLDKKSKAIFKIYDITYWETHNCNTDIAQYLQK